MVLILVLEGSMMEISLSLSASILLATAPLVAPVAPLSNSASCPACPAPAFVRPVPDALLFELGQS